MFSDPDGDGIVNRLDLDSDNDGITDNVEAQTTQGYIAPSGQGAAMVDIDNDGLDDVYDANTANTTAAVSLGLTPVDTDSDGTKDYVDSDADGDGVADIVERGDGQATSITSTLDTDQDGLFDIFEAGTVSDGFDVNDNNVTGTTQANFVFNLGDSDSDMLANGSNAAPRNVDFNYRDDPSAPVNVLPPVGWTTNEDATVAITGISVTDNAANGTYVVQLTVASGTLAATSGGNVTVSGSGTSVLTLSGLLADINAYLAAASAPVYTPVANNNGTVNLQIVTKDGGGGAGALTDTDHATITINPVNDAPVLDNAPVLTYTAQEDDPAPVGAVGALISAFTGGSSDVDAGALKGIAITAAAPSSGTWWYTTDGGTTWLALGAVSNTSALLLADNAQTRLYFQATTLNFNGTGGATALTFRAWDQTSGVTGTKVTTATNGGTSAFSIATDTVAVTIAAVNDAPVMVDTALTVAGGTEDVFTAPTGAVGTLVSSLVGGVSDVDAGAVKGIAVIGADTANGVWWFSTNNGTSWSVMPTVSNANALLLTSASNARVFFQPNVADWNGVSNITIRGWDTTGGFANGATTDVSVNGGITPFSLATDTAGATVAAVADILADTANGVNATNEDTAKTFNPITGINVNAGGADSFENTSGPLKRIITSVGGTVVTNGAATGATAIVAGGPAVAVANGMVSLALDGETLTFTPNADFNGTATFAYTVASGGVFESANISITVTAVGDAPRIDLDTTTAGTGYVANYDQDAIAIGNLVSVTDPEANNLNSMTVTLSGAQAGDTLLVSGSAAASGTASGIAWTRSGNTITFNTANGTLANYQAALGLVTFSTTSNVAGARTVSVSAVSSVAPTASNDGVPAVATITLIDTDGDGTANAADIDDDNDGILDTIESPAPLITDGGFTSSALPTGWFNSDQPYDGTSTVIGTGFPNSRLTGGLFDVLNPNGNPDTGIRAIVQNSDSATPAILYRFSSALLPGQYQYAFDLSSRTAASTDFYNVAIYDHDTDQIVTVLASAAVNTLPDMNTAAPAANYTNFSGTFQISTAGNYSLIFRVNPNGAGNGDYLIDRVAVASVLPDIDSDGIVNRLDLDSDNDGITDNVEAQTTQGYIAPSGQGAAMVDIDNDGLDDVYDANTANVTAAASLGRTPVDTDGDGAKDYLDADSDDDGTADIAERGDGQPLTVTSTTDTDRDGLLDIFEAGTINDGFDVNDNNLAGTAFNLADSDNDTNANGSNAAPRGRDLDYRDDDPPPAPTPVVDLDANDSSGVIGGDYTTTYTENAAGVAIADADATIVNVPTLVSASAVIANGVAGDVLYISGTLPSGTVATWNVATFTLSLTGNASAASYQAALAQIHYAANSQSPSATPRTINVVVNDGVANSNTAVSTINVVPVNDLPAVDLNSGRTVTEIITNGGAVGGVGWTTTGSGMNATITQTGRSGWDVGLAPSGAAELAVSVTLTNVTGDSVPTTMEGSIGGVVYWRITSGTGATTGATIEYLNGATGVLTTLAAGATTTIIVELPAIVAATGDLAFSFASGTPSDTISVFSVSATTFVDQTAGNNFATSYAENSAPVSIADTDSDVRDDDNASMASATIVLTNAQGGDVLGIIGSLPAGISSSIDTSVPGQITVTLSGVATRANYAAAIRAIGFSTTGDNPSIAPRIVNVTVNDGVANSAAAVTTIGVVAINDALALDLDGNDSSGATGSNYATNYTENGASVAIADGDVSITDADSTTIASATVTLTNPQAGDRLLVNGSAAASGTLASGIAWTRTDNLVTLSGTFSQADYLAALQLVTFESTGDNPVAGARTVTIAINDGTASSTASTTINVVPINDAPVLDLNGAGTAGANYTTSYTENGAAVAIADIANTITDIDDTNMESATIALTNAQTGDRLLVNGSPAGSGTLPGGIAWTRTDNLVTLTGLFSKADYQAALQLIAFENAGDNPGNLARSITVAVYDGDSVSNTATTTINVVPVNDAPSNTVPGAQTATEDMPLAITGTSVADADTATLTASLSVANGQLTVTSGGGLGIAGNGTATVTLTGTAAQINAALAGLSYANTPDYNGPDLLTIATSDNGGTSFVTNTVAIDVAAVADIVNDINSTPEDTATDINVLGNDSFENLARQVTAVTQPAGGEGVVSINPDGTIHFAPAANFNGTATFTYTVTSGGVTETANVTVIVTAVNDAPSNTVPGAQTSPEDTALAIPGVSVADTDSATLTTTLSVAHGTLAVTEGGGVSVSNNNSSTVTLTGTAAQINAALLGLTYANTQDYYGPDQLTVVTSDGPQSDSDTVAITVSAVADATDDVISTPEDTAITFNVFTGADADTFENPGRQVTAVTQPTGGQGTVTFDANGDITFTPAVNFNGTASFTYTVTSGGVTETATVTVTVTAVDDAPNHTVPTARTTAEDTSIVFSSANGNAISVSDVDNGSLTATLTVARGTLTVAAGSGATVTGDGGVSITISGTVAQINAALNGLTYAPTADYNGDDQIAISTSDGTLTGAASVDITVTPVADIAGDSISTAEDTPLDINVLGNDTFENPGRQVTAVTQPAGGAGVVAINPDGTIHFVPALNFNGTTTFTYSVTSGDVTENATVTVTVTAVNDAPVITVPGPQTTAEDTPLGISGVSIQDVDSAALTTTVSVLHGSLSFGASSAVVVFNADHSQATITGTATQVNGALAGLTYTNLGDYNGPDTLTVLTNDGSLSDQKTVAISVSEVADISNDTASTDEGEPVVIAVLANDSFENAGRVISAVDGAAIVAGGSAVTVANGVVRLTAAGELVFQPADDFNGSTDFTYTVTSGGVTETATVTVSVASVNTPPTNTLPPVFSTIEDTSLSLAGLQLADTDAGAGSVSVTLSVNSGALAATSTGTVTVTGSGSGSITLAGSIADINAFLASVASRPVFAPAANAVANVTLTMTTNDNGNTGGPGLTDVDTATITITPVNDAPQGADGAASIAEDTSYTFSAADFGFSDLNDNPANVLMSVTLTTIPATGVLSLAGSPVTAGQVISAANIGQLTWTPPANASGAGLASFTFQVQDSGGGANGGGNIDLSPNIFTFNVTPVDDAPVNTMPAAFATDEDTVLGLTGLQIADIDAASGALTVTLSVSSGRLSAVAGPGVTVSGSGSASLVLTGTLDDLNTYLASAARPNFTPLADFNGSVTLTMVTNDQGNTGAGGPLTDTDTATITVAPVNDAPVGSGTSLVTNEDTPFTGTLPIATDVDGDTITYGPGAPPAHGTVSIDAATGNYTYTPDPNYNGPDSFTYTVSDGTVTVTYTVGVTVNAVNDTPLAIVDSASADQNTPTGLNVLDNDIDADHDPLTVVGVGAPTGNVGVAVAGSNGGLFTIAANGTATFDPNGAFVSLGAGQTATSSISYRTSDGAGGFATATFTVTIVGLDDLPVSAPIANQTSIDAQAITLDVSGNFSDPDSGDTLDFSASGLPSGLTIDPVTGVISGTIDRSASLTDPYGVTVTATDGDGHETSRSFTWTVLNPVPTAQDDAFSTTENAGLSGGSVFASNGNGADSDPDGDPFTVSAVNGAAIGVGVPVTGSSGGTFTINANGTFTFVPGTAFDHLAAGATETTSVTYTISDGEGGFATATVLVTVTGLNDAPVAANDSFTTNEDTPATFEVRGNDSDVDGGTLVVTSINGTAISLGNPVAVTGGVVSINANGTLTFAPALNFNGTPSFTYTISDGQGGSATATVNGTVVAVQDLPVAVDDSFITNEDTTVTVSLIGNDSDVDGDPLTVTQINGADVAPGETVAVTNGTVTVNGDGTVTFAPAADFNGSPLFTYTISDGHGATATATVNGVVNPVDDAPDAVNDSFTTNEDTPVTFGVLGNDTDADGDTLTVTEINGTPVAVGVPLTVTGGTVILNADGTLTFTPALNFNGAANFTYTVSDGNGGTDTAAISGTVAAVNDAPVAVNDSYATNEDDAVTFDVRTNDTDVENDALAVTQINGANIAVGGSIVVTGGTVALGADGQLTFTPALNFNGVPSFQYTVSDGHGGVATATVTVTVNPLNDAPVAVDDSFSTQEDTPVTFSVLGNDSDIDTGDTLTITEINGTSVTVGVPIAVAGGAVTLNGDGTLTFTPALDFSGTPSFNYTVSDGNGGTATATVSGSVGEVNDPPVAADVSVNTIEDTPIVNGTLPAATDADNDPVTYGAGSTVPSHGSVTINANGTYTYTPTLDFNGADTFSYVVSDGRGGSNEYTVTVNVAPANDPPTGEPLPDRIRADGETFDYDVSGFFSDPDGDTLNFVITGLPAGLTYDAATGVISGTIDRNASAAVAGGVYHITVTSWDRPGATGLSTSRPFDLTVTNPAPTAVNDAVTTPEDTQIVGIDVLANDTDPDSDPLTITSASAGNGTVTIVDGKLNYLPNLNFNGTDTIIYTISDGNGGSSTATVTVTVTPVNDAPTADQIADLHDDDSTDFGDIDPNNAIDFSSYFHDVDNPSLAFTATGLPGGLSIDASGKVTGTIDSDASTVVPDGIYHVTVTATDAGGLPVSQTFTWYVDNPPPTAFNDTLAGVVTEDSGPTDVDAANGVLPNDFDPDGDGIYVSEVNGQPVPTGGLTVNGSNGGTFTVRPDGSYTFTPGPSFQDLAVGETRATTITYAIIDSDGAPSGPDTATLTVIVTGVNDAPTADLIPAVTRADGDTFTPGSPLDVSDFFHDVDIGDVLSFDIDGLPAGLTFDAATGQITGTIDSSASQVSGGVYTVSVTASDGNNGSVTRTFTFNVTNPAPTAVNDIGSTNEDTAVDIDVVTNDTDPDNDTLVVDPTFTPIAGHGTVTINLDGTLHYVPDADFNGTDTIVYRVSDGQGGLSTGSVTVTVNPVNDVPVVDLDNSAAGLGHTATFTEGGAPVAIANGDASAFDVEDQILDLDIALGGFTDGSAESIHIGGGVELSYGMPQSGTVIFGTTTFAYSYDGANGLHFDNNAGPAASIPGAEASALIQALRYENGNDNPTAGIRTLSFTATDAGGATSAPAVASIGVIPANDNPVANNDSAATDQNTRIEIGLNNVLTNDSDAEHDDLIVTAVGAGAPGTPVAGTNLGTFVINANGTYTFDPLDDFDDLQADETRTTSVQYTVSDGNGGTSIATLTVTVTGVNDAPVGADDAITTAEDTAFTGTLPAATDADGDVPTYAVAGQPAHGTVSVSSDGTYIYTPNLNYNGPDSFTYTVNDGDASVTYTVDIDVTPVNDAPSGSTIPAITRADAQTISYDTSVFFNDLDGDTLNYLITGLPSGLTYDAASGVISGTIASDASQGGVGGVYTVTVTSYDGPGGTGLSAAQSFDLTVTNPTPIARDDARATDENTAISGSVLADNGNGIDNDPDGDDLTVSAVNGVAIGVGAPIPGSSGGTFVVNANGDFDFDPGTSFDALKPGQSRTTSIHYTISDGQGGTSIATLTVTVTGVNDAPQGTLHAISTDEDVAASGTLPIATDADGDPLQYGLDTQAAHGTVTVNPNGTYTYIPDPDYNGSDSFIYSVSDGTTTTTYLVTVTVNPVNDAPTVTNDARTTAEDTDVSGAVIGSDVDNDPLGYELGIGPAQGSVTVNGDGTYSYTPGLNYNGQDSFTIIVTDPDGATATATVTINVTGLNDTPVAVDDAATTNENTIKTGNVILDVPGRDTDADGDNLQVVSVDSQSAGASVTGSGGGIFVIAPDGSYSFDPGNDFQDMQASESRTTSVEYTISDGHGGIDTATLTITVTGVNDAPTAPALPPRSSIDGAVVSYNAGAVFSDVDGDTLVFSAAGLPAGLIFDTATGAISGTIDKSASGATGTAVYSVTITAEDGHGGSQSRSFNWTVTNPVPTAVDDAFTIAEDGTLSGVSVLAANGAGADSDPDIDPLAVSVVTGPAHGSLTLNPDGTFIYAANANFKGIDTFTYKIDDGNGGTDTATVTITVTSVNDAPAGADKTVTVDEDTSYTFAAADFGFTNANDPGDTLSAVIITTSPSNGVLTLGGVPVTAGQEIPAAQIGMLVWTPALDQSGSPLASFTFQVRDNSGTVNGGVDTDQSPNSFTFNINPVNDAPVNTLPATFNTTEDTPLQLAGLSVADVDAATGPITVTLSVDAGALSALNGPGVTVSGSGSASITLNGTLADINAYLLATAPTYAPVADAHAPVTLTMTTDDDGNTGSGGRLTDTDTVTILIQSVNDDPMANGDTRTTQEDMPVAGAVTATDVDGDDLTYTLGAQPANGSVVVNPDGTYLYTPNANFNGSDTFDILVDDGHGGQATATVTITVTPVNDAPVGRDTTLTTSEDTPFSGTLPPATDIEGDTLTYGAGTQPGHGALVVNPDGTYTYTPDPDYAGPDSFTYTVSDGTTTVTYTVSVAVTPVNDAPVGGDATAATDENTPISGTLTATDVDGDPLTYGPGTPPAHGTVIVNPDGTYTYTPNPDYNGPDSFTYSVSDGTTISIFTVSITVNPIEGMLERDPPTPVYRDPIDLPERPFVVHGAVLTAIGDLGGISTSFDDNAIIGSTVGGVKSLNSTSDLGQQGVGLSAEGAVGQAVHQASQWYDGVLTIDELLLGAHNGGSMILSTEGVEKASFLVDTVFRDERLYILISGRETAAGSHRPIDFRVTLADGRALPDWLLLTRQGLAIGLPPAGLAFIDIRIQAAGDDDLGSDTVRIELATGLVTSHSGDKRAAAECGLFSHMLTAEARGGHATATELAKALACWAPQS